MPIIQSREKKATFLQPVKLKLESPFPSAFPLLSRVSQRSCSIDILAFCPPPLVPQAYNACSLEVASMSNGLCVSVSEKPSLRAQPCSYFEEATFFLILAVRHHDFKMSENLVHTHKLLSWLVMMAKLHLFWYPFSNFNGVWMIACASTLALKVVVAALDS
ncbi:unnamed protein product [Sphenostylis stenocarpa]|uniref:Uncharacterized protein n=1 Tax=Sphenostylis stenocarpa TaxID=92480 RepID=A0AA86VSP1_9FABA|nr:unnamed protein product [Sphenostylis stenocarpa]